MLLNAHMPPRHRPAKHRLDRTTQAGATKRNSAPPRSSACCRATCARASRSRSTPPSLSGCCSRSQAGVTTKRSWRCP